MIGTQWQSPNGLRTVEHELEHGGRKLYGIRTGSSAFLDLVPVDGLEAERARDESRLAYAAAKQAEREAAERAEAERKAACPLERYLASLPAMKAGRARKSLDALTRVNGGPISTRARHLLDLFSKGYRARGDKLECEGARGFFDRAAFTSYGLEFVAFLEREGVPA